MSQELDLTNISPAQVKTELCKRSLKAFVKTFWHIIEPAYPFKDNWHLDLICTHLENIFDVRQLLINVPPRSSKTLIIQCFFPAWLWITHPSTRFLFATYAKDLSIDSSVKCRQLISSNLYKQLFGKAVSFKEDQNTKTRFDTVQGGQRMATSVLGSSTGYGCDILVCDEPHNVGRAESETDRKATIAWFENVFFNRVNDGNKCARLVVGQRTHKYDLSGFLLEHFPDEWTHINIPYESKHNHPVPCGWAKLGLQDPRDKAGQQLWEGRFPEREIRQYKRNRHVWETQWQQDPTDSDNSIFHPDQFLTFQETNTQYIVPGRKVDKSSCFRMIACDLAFSRTADSDYTGLMVADISPQGDMFIIHLVRERMASTRIVQTMVQLNEQFQPAYFLIEDVVFQRIVIEQARIEGLAVRPIYPEGTKETRSIPLQIRLESGQVFFAPHKPWLTTIHKELIEFPNGSHDDTVDCLIYIALQTNRHGSNKTTPDTPVTPQQRKAQEDAEYQAAILQGTDD